MRTFQLTSYFWVEIDKYNQYLYETSGQTDIGGTRGSLVTWYVTEELYIGDTVNETYVGTELIFALRWT